MRMNKQNRHLWLALTGCIFVGEFLIMLMLHAIPKLNPWVEAFIDATVLSVFVAMFIFVLWNVSKTIDESTKAEEKLR